MRSRLLQFSARHGRTRVIYLVGFAAAILLISIVAWGEPCADCHEDQVVALETGPHRGLAKEGALCVACHGDPAKHLESNSAEDIVGPAAIASWSAEKQASACLSCHGAMFPAASDAPHMGRVSCWSCHWDRALHTKPDNAIEPAAKRHATWELCTSCHEETKAQFRLRYRHPVESGAVDCTSCHDIHGRESNTLDREVESETCESCHEAQAGPYLYDHATATSSCASCHKAHGSWNRGLLLTTGNGICLNCHLQSNFPGVGNTPHNSLLGGGGRCWDCHSEVHGSNTTPDFNPRGRR